MPLLDFESVSVNNLTTPEINMDTDPPTATLRFNARVSVDASASRYGARGTGLSRVTLNYEKSADGKWRIRSYSHEQIRIQDFMGGG